MKIMHILVAVAMSAAVVCSAADGDEQTKTMTQLELAKIMVQLTGLQSSLPTDRPVTDADYFSLLMFNNIQPTGGWHAEQSVSRADLARVVVLGMQEGSKVENPENPQSWVDYLVSKGVRVDTVGTGTNPVTPIAFPVGVDPTVAVTEVIKDVVKPLPPVTPTGARRGARI